MVFELALIHNHGLNIIIIVFPFIGASWVLHVNLNPVVGRWRCWWSSQTLIDWNLTKCAIHIFGRLGIRYAFRNDPAKFAACPFKATQSEFWWHGVLLRRGELKIVNLNHRLNMVTSPPSQEITNGPPRHVTLTFPTSSGGLGSYVVTATLKQVICFYWVYILVMQLHFHMTT